MKSRLANFFVMINQLLTSFLFNREVVIVNYGLTIFVLSFCLSSIKGLHAMEQLFLD